MIVPVIVMNAMVLGLVGVMLASVPATVMSALVQVQNITVRQVMLFAQIQLVHVTVQAVVPNLIVSHVLIPMVSVGHQPVAVMFVGMILHHMMA